MNLNRYSTKLQSYDTIKELQTFSEIITIYMSTLILFYYLMLSFLFFQHEKSEIISSFSFTSLNCATQHKNDLVFKYESSQ